MTGAVALGVRLGLAPSQPSESPPPAPAARVSPEATTADSVRQSIAGYREQASLFAARRTACADLARGLTAVDEAWLRYTLAAPSGAAGDSLAVDVDQVEADFERSGCPRP